MINDADVELENLRLAQDVEGGKAPTRRDPGIALCMSGGGYRAAIFHLGAMLRLHQTGLLATTALFSSVSGGSIVQGWLVSRYLLGRAKNQSFEDWCNNVNFSAEVIEPFREVVSSDIRTETVLMTLPYNWYWSNDRMRFLQLSYERLFAGNIRLEDLPDKPEFVFCATDMTFGVNWEFSKKRAGDWLAGYIKDHEEIAMAQAIAASSAFPPLFGPMRMGRSARYSGGSYVGDDRKKLQARLELTDGGVYDNLGTEPAIKKYATVLISDAGAPFAFSILTGWRRLMRYTQVIGNQAVSLRKRMFFSLRRRNEIAGAHWGIADSGQIPVDGYSKRLVNEVIGRIRTDLDRFTPGEFEVLVNHGYLTCNNALQYLGNGSSRSANPVWPFPSMQNEDIVRSQLRTSHRRFFHLRWFGRSS